MEESGNHIHLDDLLLDDNRRERSYRMENRRVREDKPVVVGTEWEWPCSKYHEIT